MQVWYSVRQNQSILTLGKAQIIYRAILGIILLVIQNYFLNKKKKKKSKR